jgi:hypothetical protein
VQKDEEVWPREVGHAESALVVMTMRRRRKRRSMMMQVDSFETQLVRRGVPIKEALI